jgi:hypothetical protein
MPRVESERFGDVETCRIYIAARLGEAKTVEEVLSDGGVEYSVEIEKFGRRLLGIIPREYHGAAFYVAAHDADACLALLQRKHLIKGLTDD